MYHLPVRSFWTLLESALWQTADMSQVGSLLSPLFNQFFAYSPFQVFFYINTSTAKYLQIAFFSRSPTTSYLVGGI